MKPLQRTFVPSARSVRRVDLSVCRHPLADPEPAYAAACEVREMAGMLGHIEWRESAMDYDRAFEDTYPSQLE